MNRCTIAIFLAFSLSACDSLNTLTDGFQQSQAVASEMEKSIGSKPFVGFNWNNGSLTSVTVNFEGIPKDKAIAELAEIARVSIKKQFKQEPQQIVLGFSIKP